MISVHIFYLPEFNQSVWRDWDADLSIFYSYTASTVQEAYSNAVLYIKIQEY